MMHKCIFNKFCGNYLEEDYDLDICPECLVEGEDYKIEKFGRGWQWLSQGREFTEERRLKKWRRKRNEYM